MKSGEKREGVAINQYQSQDGDVLPLADKMGSSRTFCASRSPVVARTGAARAKTSITLTQGRPDARLFSLIHSHLCSNFKGPCVTCPGIDGSFRRRPFENEIKRPFYICDDDPSLSRPLVAFRRRQWWCFFRRSFSTWLESRSFLSFGGFFTRICRTLALSLSLSLKLSKWLSELRTGG